MNKKIKVLALIWDMGNGGAQQVVVNNLRYFKEDADIDYKVVSFCPPNGSKNDIVIMNEELNVEYVGYPKSIVKIPIIRYPFNKRVERLTWEKIIRREKPDVVHVHISELLLTTLGPIVKCDVPVRFDTLHSNPYRYKGRALRCVRRAFQKEGFIPICLNDKQVREAKDHYGISKYEIVRNGFDFSKIKGQIVSKKEARKRLGISDDDFVLVGVGRLDPIKNYELMIDVFSEVLKVRSDAKLVIAGGGDTQPYVDRAKAYEIEDGVVFLGHITNVTDVYCAADVLLMTSHSEASPLTLVEAQVCGTRCVVSNGVPEESVITNLVSRMLQDSSASDWADVVINGGYHVEPRLSERDYDLSNANDKIKQLYIDYWKKTNE
ncbi:glycosyltransferase [Butyrivibrio sp. INlla14]|uniref:glycosyltransferase n=1 Tax=Butyrivibrio sp. INlla14 TaxID=1520808 RepID=UPI000875F7CA|nr:glycosyltransferase [Butyrivibrio sp. INlla14]SCY70237.1 Glycosyltransferase involved in cell wall bisynthesis [Butyrivibrio sp. INlla14]